ncbi:fibronectin type III domain-containing protein, partial [Aeromicrobium sp. IC_218]|uniref:fibronectin type III domain-containing protein n=1 Tax=Aeromicrobium sp. IC_218 TaxID=2545468 RepID=UPI0010E22DBB
PALPAVPRGLRLTTGDARLDVRWASVSGTDRYDVTWRESGRPGTTRTTRTTGPSVRLTGLVAGRRYAVAVRAVAAGRAGAAAVVTGRAGGPTAGAPRRPRAALRGTGSVRLSWTAGARATRYEVWRTYRGSTRRVAVTSRTRVVLDVPRRAGAAFRIRSWHQDLPGRWSSRVRPPLPR